MTPKNSAFSGENFCILLDCLHHTHCILKILIATSSSILTIIHANFAAYLVDILQLISIHQQTYPQIIVFKARSLKCMISPNI